VIEEGWETKQGCRFKDETNFIPIFRKIKLSFLLEHGLHDVSSLISYNDIILFLVLSHESWPRQAETIRCLDLTLETDLDISLLSMLAGIYPAVTPYSLFSVVRQLDYASDCDNNVPFFLPPIFKLHFVSASS